MSKRNADCEACCGSAENLSRGAWQSRYETGAMGWDRGTPNAMLIEWLEEGVLKPCKIVVPGCGRGHEVIALADSGFEVTAIDFADAALDSLRNKLHQRGLNASVIHSDLFAVDNLSAFDAIYEQTSLYAIHPSQWDTYQQKLACWLRPGGRLFALFMQSDRESGPPYSCDLTQMHELFSHPSWLWSPRITRVEHPSGMHEFACIITRNENVL